MGHHEFPARPSGPRPGDLVYDPSAEQRALPGLRSLAAFEEGRADGVFWRFGPGLQGIDRLL